MPHDQGFPLDSNATSPQAALEDLYCVPATLPGAPPRLQMVVPATVQHVGPSAGSTVRVLVAASVFGSRIPTTLTLSPSAAAELPPGSRTFLLLDLASPSIYFSYNPRISQQAIALALQQAPHPPTDPSRDEVFEFEDITLDPSESLECSILEECLQFSPPRAEPRPSGNTTLHWIILLIFLPLAFLQGNLAAPLLPGVPRDLRPVLHVLGLCLLGIGAAMAGAAWLLARPAPPRPFRIAERATVSQAGVDRSTSLSQAHADWPMYQRFLESPRLILLQSGTGLRAIPKRLFPDLPALDRFRRFLSLWLPAQRIFPCT